MTLAVPERRAAPAASRSPSSFQVVPSMSRSAGRSISQAPTSVRCSSATSCPWKSAAARSMCSDPRVNAGSAVNSAR